MDIFSSNSKGVEVWGPIASVTVKAGALGNIDSWILEGVTIGAKEIVDVRQCFSDVAYLYALGNDQSRCTIALSFAVFIGAKECQGGNNTKAIDDGLKAYASGRISKHTSPMQVGIGSFARNGWLVGLDIGNVDPIRGVAHAVASFIMELA